MSQGGFSEIFSRDNARKQAERYNTMSFIEKPKNIVGLFYVAALIYSVVKVAAFPLGDTEYLLRLICIVAYSIFALFVFANKQTAMAIGAAFFVAMTVSMFVFVEIYLIRAPILAFFCVALTVRASHVADALRAVMNQIIEVETFD